MQVDSSKFVYMITPGTDELSELVIRRLVEYGFEQRQILDDDARIRGEIGDYVVKLVESKSFSELELGRITQHAARLPEVGGYGEVHKIKYDVIAKIPL